MQLPNADRAILEPRKLRDYLLSAAHPVGRHKARFFVGLGYSSEDWAILANDLRGLALRSDAVEAGRTKFGQKYDRRGVDYADWRGRAEIRDGLSGGLMTYKLLDTVVLDRDLPDRGLHRGDVGAVVEVYPPDSIEVEFVTVSGRTEALVTLSESDVRPGGEHEVLAVRPN